MNTLYFEKISQFDRHNEPVALSIPFAKGGFKPDQFLKIQDDGNTLPVQTRPLAHWDDGSVKWLRAYFQPDLPGNDDKTLTFNVVDDDPCIPSDAGVIMTETEDGLCVDTGPLQFTIPREGFLPITNVLLNGNSLWNRDAFQGFFLNDLHTQQIPVTLEIEEAGSRCVVILLKAKHWGAKHKQHLTLNGRITAYAGKPYIEIEHQFVHDGEEEEIRLNALNLRFAPETSDSRPPQLALGQGYYRTAIEESSDQLSMSLTTETMLYQANEHFIDSFYGDFWVDWRDANGGLALSIYQAHQNFPKKLVVDQGGIVCGLYPDDAESIPVLQGMGKTHRILLHFHDGSLPLEDITTRSLQFQLPDHPTLSREWYAENNPWLEKFFPEHLPGRLMTLFNQLHDGRPKALGMFHFGDAPDAGYTDQGRGKGETVWVNNEYDRTHACTLYYGLTGQRRVLDSAIVSARHWLDVDYCHYNPNPLLNGGLRMHDVYHATGKVIPSHSWVEGFLDYYFLTGRQEGMDVAVAVGENIIRLLEQPHMRHPGSTQTREAGWALRAMVGMYLGTGHHKWKEEATRIIEMFLSWSSEYNGLLAPYTSHSMPRVVFMISLTVNSFARYLFIEDDQRIKDLIVRSMDDVVEHCMGPDGIFYYKELPSLKRYAPTAHVLEALTYCYRITGKQQYLKIAARQFAALASGPIGVSDGKKYVDASGAVIKGHGGGRIFADKYTSILIFAAEAASLGLLDWYEYPYHESK